MVSKINVSRFYFEWKGHQISDLTFFQAAASSISKDKPIIYLAGDSSLDNKYWVSPGLPEENLTIPEIYNVALDKRSIQRSIKPDVAFWMNHYLEDQAITINAAVEESMLRERDSGLLPHDGFVRNNIREQDILVVSVGANDIALRPTMWTALHMLRLSWLTTAASLESGTAWSYSHFVSIFKNKVEKYISKMIELHKPRAVIVCMIYFPLQSDIGSQSSWADLPLKFLGYEKDPKRLQTAIRKMYELATKNIKIEGTEVIPCPLFEVLDGKVDEDYVSRVEPSEGGGKKMAMQFKNLIEPFL